MTQSHSARSNASSDKRPRADSGRPDTMNRRQRHSKETRTRLFRSALELIARHGLANVTVEDITEAADVGKGTFFNYFASKEHVLGSLGEVQLAKVREVVALVAGGRKPIRPVLHELMRVLVKEPGRSPRLAQAMIISFLASQSVRTSLKRNIVLARRAIAQVIETGQKRGEIDKRLLPEKAAMQFLQTMMGSTLLWSVHEAPRLSVWIEQSFDGFWRSIVAPKASRRRVTHR